MNYAASRHVAGHKDWRVPTQGELNVLFENRAKIGGFNRRRSSGPASWYWSSTQAVDDSAWCQRFSSGYQDWHRKNYQLSLRCVRG